MKITDRINGEGLGSEATFPSLRAGSGYETISPRPSFRAGAREGLGTRLILTGHMGDIFLRRHYDVVMEKGLKSIRVHLAAGSVEVKTVYITARSNAHVSNICGRAKRARGVHTVGIRALAYFRYCIPAVKRTPRTLLMRHTANFVSGPRGNSRSGQIEPTLRRERIAL